MKKKLAALLIGACSVMLVACGSSDAEVSGVEALPMEQTESVEETESASTAETAASSEAEASSETVESSEVDASSESDETDEETTVSWLGDWHEENLGMNLTVTENGDGYKYVINWPDSENNMTFVWEMNGVLNEIGMISYHDGVASVIEKDEDGNDTTSVLSDHEQGTFALLNDGTLQWIEEVEVEVEHIFTR